jgi:hypothetical protein
LALKFLGEYTGENIVRGREGGGGVEEFFGNIAEKHIPIFNNAKIIRVRQYYACHT